MKPIVSPENCAIAVSIPLAREEFLRQFHLGVVGGYVHENTKDSGPAVPGEVHWGCYTPQAELFASVLNDVEKAGVKIVRNAAMGDFHSLLAQYDVVTLVAHWKSAIFRTSDLVDPAALSEALRRGDSLLANLLSVSDMDDLIATGAPEPLLSCLNRVMLVDNPRPTKHSGLGQATRFQMTLHARREKIEACMPGMFRGGASVEFADGFHTVAEIVNALPEKMQCLLDLSVCNSLTLATKIKERCPGSYILCNEEVTHLTFRAAIYRQVIRSIKRRPGNFEEVTFSVRRLLGEEK